MSDQMSFERRFATALNHYADQVRMDVEADRITALARAASERSWVRRLGFGRRLPPDLRWILIASAALLIVAVAALSVVGAWRLRPIERPALMVTTDQFFQVGPQGDGGWWDAALLADGTVLVVGGLGRDSMPETGATAILDARAGTLRATGPLITPRLGASLTTLQDGRVLIAGGIGQDASLASAEIYDPRTGAFSPAAPMRSAARGHTATLLDDGRVLVVGFEDGQAEIYDPVSDSWRFAGRTVARGFQTATRLTDGRVLIVGGFGGSQRVTAASELFDPSTETFSESGTLELRRNQHAAVLLDDGGVLVVGGSTNPDGFTLDTEVAGAEVYDPTTGAFRAAADLRWARGGPDAVRLADGRVAVLGGFNAAGSVLVTELFDPNLSAFSEGPRVAGHTRAALGVTDGWVLVVSEAGIEILVPTGAVRPTWAPPD